MKQNKESRNIRIIAENAKLKDGFNIYLDFSGQKEYLIYHRNNGRLYNLLKDGVAVADMKRWSPAKIGSYRTKKTGAAQIYDTVHHLISVIDSYMIEREAY